jgi:UPF0716 protein FxsA
MNLLLIVVFGAIAEILVWIGVGDLVGSMWYVFFWFVITFFVGLNLVRSSTSNIMPQLQQMQMTGQLGAESDGKTSASDDESNDGRYGW